MLVKLGMLGQEVGEQSSSRVEGCYQSMEDNLQKGEGLSSWKGG